MKVDIDTDIPIVRETVKALDLAGDSANTAVAQFLADSIEAVSEVFPEDAGTDTETWEITEGLMGELEDLKAAADFAINKLSGKVQPDLTVGKYAYLIRTNCEYSIELLADTDEEALAKADKIDVAEWTQAWAVAEIDEGA